jgi:hypothetical protein
MRRLANLVISNSRSGRRSQLTVHLLAFVFHACGYPTVVDALHHCRFACVCCPSVSCSLQVCLAMCRLWVHCGARTQLLLPLFVGATMLLGGCSCGRRSGHTALGTAAGKCRVGCLHNCMHAWIGTLVYAVNSAVVFRKTFRKMPGTV